MRRLLKKAYRKLPFKKQLFSAVKIFGVPKENIYKHLYFNGDFTINLNKQHSFRIRHYGYELENSLFWTGINGGWEKISLSLWSKLATEANVILDIGANTGVYSLVAKSLNQHSQVFAFEPVERVFKKLQCNNKLNNFDITCFDYALSDKDGKAVIYDTDSEHIYSVTVNKNLQDVNTTVTPIEISTVKLSTFIEENGLKKIDLIKLDVETHEVEVLEGMGEYLELFKPTMLVEILNDEVGRGVERLVKNKGYVFFNIDDIEGTVRQVEHLTKSDYFNYLICNPTVAEKLNLLNH